MVAKMREIEEGKIVHTVFVSKSFESMVIVNDNKQVQQGKGCK
jgi:hypothetical protein